MQKPVVHIEGKQTGADSKTTYNEATVDYSSSSIAYNGSAIGGSGISPEITLEKQTPIIEADRRITRAPAAKTYNDPDTDYNNEFTLYSGALGGTDPAPVEVQVKEQIPQVIIKKAEERPSVTLGY